jgi:hypothetical protein
MLPFTVVPVAAHSAELKIMLSIELYVQVKVPAALEADARRSKPLSAPQIVGNVIDEVIRLRGADGLRVVDRLEAAREVIGVSAGDIATRLYLSSLMPVVYENLPKHPIGKSICLPASIASLIVTFLFKLIVTSKALKFHSRSPVDVTRDAPNAR